MISDDKLKPRSNYSIQNSEGDRFTIQPLETIKYNGIITLFSCIQNIYIIGFKDGKVQIKVDRKTNEIQLSSPKLKKGLFTGILTSLNPYASQVKLRKRTDFLTDIVNISYSKYKQTEEKTIDMSIVAAELSDDQELLLLSTEEGEIYIYHYSNLRLIDVVDLVTPQTFLKFYQKSTSDSMIYKAEHLIFKPYTFICCDVYGNLHKFYIDLYKVIDKRTLQYTHYQLLEYGQVQYQTNKWWEDKQFQYLNQGINKILINVKWFMNSTFLLLWNDRFEVIEVYDGKKKDVPQFKIIKQIQFINLDRIIDRYNNLSINYSIRNDPNIGSISVGAGMIYDFIRNSKNKIQSHLLLFNIGSVIYILDSQYKLIRIGIFRQKLIESDSSEEDLYIIQHVYFITDNLIGIVCQNNYFNIIHLDELLDIEYMNQVQKQSSKISQMSISDLTTFTIFGIENQELFISNRNPQHNIEIKMSIKDNYFINSLIFLDSMSRVQKFQIMNWQLYLLQFVDKRKYQQGISEIYKTVNNNINYLSQLPFYFNYKLMSNIIEQLCIKYLEDDEHDIQTTQFIQEFLVFTKNEGLLFNQLMAKYCIKHTKLQFYHEIFKYQIEYIPGQLLNELSNLYDKAYFIQLLKDLDPIRVDFPDIVNVCSQIQNLDLLIHFTNSNQDFITPLERFSNNPNIINYIIMVLKGKNIKGDDILKIDQWKGIKDIINYLSTQANFVQIGAHDQEFRLANLIINQEVIQIMNSQQEYIKIQLNESQIQFNHLYQVQVPQTPSEKFIIYMIYHYDIAVKKNSFNKIKYLQLLGRSVLLQQIKITQQALQNILLKLIKVYDLARDDYLLKNSQLTQLLDIYFERQIIFEHVKLFLQLITQNITENSTIQFNLLNRIGSYHQAFYSIKQNKHKDQKQVLFGWLEQLIKRKVGIILQDHQIVELFQELLLIDPIKTYKLLNQNFYMKFDLLVDSITTLTQTPDIINGFLYFFEYILRENIYLSDSVKIKFLNYIAQNTPKKMKYYLNNYDFPVTLSLPICQKHHLLGALLIIYNKLGDYLSLLNILCGKLNRKVKECTKELIKKKELSKKSRDSIQKTLTQIRQVCQEQSYQYRDQQNLWLYSLDLFFKENPIKNLQSQSLPLIIKQELSRIILFYFSNLLQQINFYDFIQIICIKYKDIFVQVVGKAIQSIKLNIQYQEVQLHNYLRVCQQTNQKYIQKLFNIYGSGYTVFCKCLSCYKTDSNDEFVVFRCNHSFHINCLNEANQCLLCFDDLENRVYQIKYDQIILKDQKINYKQKSKLDQLKKFENSLIIKRLDYYQSVY
ncbi:hypothetical protein pb186bvf_000186 [Paramecium bursaria]